MNFLASALVIWRLYSLGLHKTYRAFFAYMAIAAARTLVLLPFKFTDPVYFQIWSATQPLLWLAHVLVVSELYFLVLRKHKGIYSLSRWFFFGAVAVAAIISAMTVFPTLTTSAAASSRPPMLSFYIFMERGIFTSLAVFLFLLLILLALFPVPISRNLLIHCSLFSIYFFASNITLLYMHAGVGRQVAILSNSGKLAIALVCYFCWAFFLTLRGEERTASLRLGRSTTKEKLLLGQLEHLNAALLRTVKK